MIEYFASLYIIGKLLVIAPCVLGQWILMQQLEIMLSAVTMP